MKHPFYKRILNLVSGSRLETCFGIHVVVNGKKRESQLIITRMLFGLFQIGNKHKAGSIFVYDSVNSYK